MRKIGGTMLDQCLVSVIIPTYMSMKYLPAALKSIVIGINVELINSEIIVVDTTPKDTIEQKNTELLCVKYGANYFNGTWRSVAASRNFGAMKSKGKFLYFIDSDCRAQPQTILNHFIKLKTLNNDVAGTVGQTILEEPLSLAGNAMKVTSFLIAFSWATFLEKVPWGATCNLMVKASKFKEIDGFDEKFFSIVGGEDVDFGWRISDRGGKWISCPDAKVIHDRRPWNNWATNIQRLFRYGIGDHYLACKHPSRLFLDPLRYPTSIILILIISTIITIFINAFCSQIFIISSILLMWIINAIRSFVRKSYKYNILECLLSEVYVMIFDIGHFQSALRHFDFRYIFLRVSHAEQQIHDCRIRLLIHITAIIIGFLLSTF